jgi:hypothetical protein
MAIAMEKEVMDIFGSSPELRLVENRIPSTAPDHLEYRPTPPGTGEFFVLFNRCQEILTHARALQQTTAKKVKQLLREQRHLDAQRADTPATNPE